MISFLPPPFFLSYEMAPPCVHTFVANLKLQLRGVLLKFGIAPRPDAGKNHPMKRSPTCWFLAGVWSLALSAGFPGLNGPAHAQDKAALKDHPYFKKLIGEWVSEAERKYADGNLVKIKQSYKVEALNDDTLTSEGTSERNGQTTQYRWTFTRTPSGLVEATYQRDTSKPDTQRYEVQVAEDGSHVEMTALLDSNARATILDSFKEGDPDTIESTLSRTDANGNAIYTATAVAKRKKG